MKNIILSLILVLFTSIAFATEIEAIVVFKNLTNKEFTSGELIIIALNQKTKVYKTDSFKITLPKKGKYQFRFQSDDFMSYSFYSKKISKNNNIITIQLREKIELNSTETYSFYGDLDSNLPDEQIEQRILAGTLNFIKHGIDSSIPKEYVMFKEKYGIGLVKVNCVIDPITFKRQREFNDMIIDYLNKKYGTKWANELEVK